MFRTTLAFFFESLLSFLFFLPIVAALGGCSLPYVAVDPRAASVAVLSDASAVPRGCEYKGLIATNYGDNFVSYSTNVENAQADLKNKAAEAGFTHIVLGTPTQPESTALFGFEGCDNCVALDAKAFVCAGGK